MEQKRELVKLYNMNDYPFELDNFNPDEDEISSEVVEHELDATDRSIARRATLQVLYEFDTTKHPIGQVLDNHIRERPESSDVRRIITVLVQGVIKHQAIIDELIQQYAPEWPIEQVAIVDRNILRIAIFEYAIQKRAPIPVIINEAVHLAQVFGAENTHSFVHGVLGAITDGEPIQIANLADDEVDTL